MNLLTFTASADEPRPRFAFQLLDGPLDFSLTPGTSTTSTLRVQNQDQNRWIEMRLSIFGLDGEAQVPTEWTSFSESAFILNPQESRDITLTITVPPNAPPLDLRLHSIAEAALITYQSEGMQPPIHFYIALGHDLYLTITPPPIIETFELAANENINQDYCDYLREFAPEVYEEQVQFGICTENEQNGQMGEKKSQKIKAKKPKDAKTKPTTNKAEKYKKPKKPLEPTRKKP